MVWFFEQQKQNPGNSHTLAMSLTFKFLQVWNFDLILSNIFRPISHA